MNSIAAIRIRGSEGIHYDVKNTLGLLHLHKKNFCVILKNTPAVRGMLQKSKDYITWGTIDEETLKLLYEKRGISYKGDPDKKSKYQTFGNKKYKPFFRLHPPRGGFERKGVKRPYTLGGALGDRKEDINRLIKQMI